MLLVFLKSVTNALVLYFFSKSRVIEKVLLCGGDRRERVLPVLINFIKVLLIETFILFPRGRVEILKATYKNILLSVSELVGAFFVSLLFFCAFFWF